ncbi:MAG: SDR family oxidoreductase [Taibaiella sp.]|nr:SDR family oxidoreductase [Taibaiella sp.]
MPYAIITGATQGIGRAVAEKYLANGYCIAVCARSKEKLKLLEQDWNERYPTASVIVYDTDLSLRGNVSAFATEITSVFPHIDVLVNNAGSFLPGNLEDEPEGLLEQMLAVNLHSAYHLTKAIIPVMKKNGSGHIFNMCSVASLKAYPQGGAYSISKYALLGFSENLREEMRAYNIKVTSVCPGATYTPSWEGSGVEPGRIMEAADVAEIIYAASCLSPQATLETIVMRPVKGDL